MIINKNVCFYDFYYLYKYEYEMFSVDFRSPPLFPEKGIQGDYVVTKAIPGEQSLNAAGGWIQFITFDVSHGTTVT